MRQAVRLGTKKWKCLHLRRRKSSLNNNLLMEVFLQAGGAAAPPHSERAESTRRPRAAAPHPLHHLIRLRMQIYCDGF